MTGEDWARLEALFDEARQRPSADRDAWLAAACPDAALREQVRDLLATYDDDPEFLEASTDIAGAVAQAVASVLEGQRLGAYRVLRQIGQGGMGVVYEAVRDDDDFARRVAIKVLPAWSGTTAAERFRRERRLLAGLDHPGIARLLDSGTTAAGAPYFVMEYVEGRPIDAWCREQRLGLRARVALVERVCAAIAYAHQRLVVHRDIKPANILVSADGEPKLLDFGVATLLSADGDSSGLTRTGQQSFTPEFASPEQIRGEAVTTASDVYSLGVLLYLLASGQRPYRLQGLSPLEVMRVVCEADPPPASSVAGAPDRAALRGPLDAVIARALRKDPAERYAAVAALQADLAAWREGQPVSAAPDGLARRFRRFVRRNRVAAAAAAAVLAALVAGGGVAVWQAGVAAAERDRAENRFRQVREFSRSLLFDVNDALARVPGNTAPRRLVVDRAVQFLDELAADAGDDVTLRMELAEGFRRLGHVQGGTDTDNLGDRDGALASFAKAVELAEGVLLRDPEVRDALALAMDATYDLVSLRLRVSPERDVRAAEARHAALLSTLERVHGRRADAAPAVARGHAQVGALHETRKQYRDAEREYMTALGMLDALPPDPDGATQRDDRAGVLKRLGAVLQWMQRLPEAEARYREALALDDARLAAAPRDPARQHEVTVTLSNLGGLLNLMGRRDEAWQFLERALAMRRALVDADPGNLLAIERLAVLLGRFSTVAYEEGRFADSVAYNREKLRMREAAVAREGGSELTVSQRALARLELAMALTAHADASPGAARAALRAEAARTLAAVTPDEYTAPTLQSSVSVAAFRQAYADLRSRLGRP